MALSRKTPLKRGKALTSRKKTPMQIQENKESRDRMWELFEKHWDLEQRWVIVDRYKSKSVQRMCENCGDIIWGQNLSIYHHHILEKGIERYEHLKYEIENLMLLCGDCHTSVTNGYPGENVKIATEEAHKRFGV